MKQILNASQSDEDLSCIDKEGTHHKYKKNSLSLFSVQNPKNYKISFIDTLRTYF